MSYSGSHHQYGHNDLQLLQNRVMVAQLQELQKHQQHGQLGDVKSQSPMTTHLSRFGKQASGGQIPNFNGGMAVNSSDIFAANNMNWMHHNVSSPVQGFSSNSYLHDQGLMMNPSLQKPAVSFYGTPVASGRAHMGHYSPVHGVSQSSIGASSGDSEQKRIPQASPYANSLFGDGTFVTRQNSPRTNSLQKNTSLLDYSGMHGQPSGTGFLHEKSKHQSDSGGTTELDPLEEKILFDSENSGWDSSLSKLAALDVEEFANSSGVTETMNPFSTVQSGSWSALMQSAVAEVSSSDTGVQEELSGLSYQNMELSTDNQPSNLVTGRPQHFKWNDSKSESSSYNLKTPPSSCDSIMSSALPSFQQTGLQSSFEQRLNKFSSDINIDQWSHLSQSLQSQQQSNQQVPSKHVRNVWQADVFGGGSGSSVLSTSDTNRNIYGQIQHQTSDHRYMPIADGTSNQKENMNTSPRYDDIPLENGPMGVDTAIKNAAQTYASQNYQGENSSDSYNSKVSHAYTAQPDHACLNAADSESSARSSQKSPNQVLCISSRGADSQQECFSSIKSDNVLHTDSDSPIQVKHNQSEDVLSKCSPTSNIYPSMDSKNTREHNKANLVSDHGGTTQFGSAVSQTERGPSQDIFSFQSSVFGDSVPANSGNEQRSQTWWMPSSFGQSVPALQGALAQNWSARSSNLGNPGFEISNLGSERLSHGSFFPGPLCGKDMSHMSVPSESISNRTETSQQVSLSGSSRHSCLLENAGVTGFQNYASGALRNTLPYMSHLNQLGMKPHSVQMSMSSQRDATVDPCKVSYNLHNFSTPYFNGKEDQSSLVEPSAQNSEIAINGEGQLDKVRFDEQKSSQNQSGKVCESSEKSKIFSPFEAFQLSSRHTDAVDGGTSCILASPANQMVTNQLVLASSMLPANADSMNLILSKSRKRKFFTYDGLPWHVEVMQNSWKLPDISVAEQGWAKATNRLVEEGVNENDTLEETCPVTRVKKKLISTSQLMQQIFQPPPPSILRVNAASDYELLVYFVAKIALADTCKLISKPRIHIPHEYGDMLINASSDGHISLMKDLEVLVERTMKLESQIERLDGSLSNVDIRRECQELGKCSLINHFAKYHGRLAQSNATDTQSPFLRRYVSPTSSPQKFPEGIKCLSL